MKEFYSQQRKYLLIVASFFLSSCYTYKITNLSQTSTHIKIQCPTKDADFYQLTKLMKHNKKRFEKTQVDTIGDKLTISFDQNGKSDFYLTKSMALVNFRILHSQSPTMSVTLTKSSNRTDTIFNVVNGTVTSNKFKIKKYFPINYTQYSFKYSN